MIVSPYNHIRLQLENRDNNRIQLFLVDSLSNSANESTNHSHKVSCTSAECNLQVNIFDEEECKCICSGQGRVSISKGYCPVHVLLIYY